MKSGIHPHHISWSLPYAGPGHMGHHARHFPNIRSLSLLFRSYLGVRLQSDVRWRGGDAVHHHMNKPDYFVLEMKKTEFIAFTSER
ncbi:MAG: hypothetical protein WAK10_00075 [Methanoregula sp.]